MLFRSELSKMIADLRAEPNILGAKISGSGLGDCVIGLGEIAEQTLVKMTNPIPVSISLQGVQCEKS